MRDLISKGLLTAAAATSVLSMGAGYAQAADSNGVAAESPGLLSGNNISAPLEVPVNICGNTVDPVGVANPSFGNGCGSTSQTHVAPHHEPAVHHAPVGHAAPAAHHQQAQHEQHQQPQHHQAQPHQAPQHEAAPHSAPQYPAHHQTPRHETPRHEAPRHESPRHETGGATAESTVAGSPGLLSGNLLQAPLDIPLNLCGDTVDVVGLLNPAFGNHCASGTPEVPRTLPAPERPAPPTEHRTLPPTPVAFHTPETPVAPAPVLEDSSVPQLAHTGADANLFAAAAMSAALLLGGGILYRRSTAPARV
ncbi:hypothetical protein HY68_14290 [Streptomyces sp. AcH 505]|uniref:chaplin n=1 Tax=Streptomyces sp. AcH 505 TaxID=352211 RepID=UPI0005924440|nr:hypothetical protein HY68_14290 [Streptomyces sp. AcH 505]